jgi:hypothetical protein
MPRQSRKHTRTDIREPDYCNILKYIGGNVVYISSSVLHVVEQGIVSCARIAKQSVGQPARLWV